MEAKELRIGNLVTWIDEENANDAILTITGLYLNDSVWLEWQWEDGLNDGTDCTIDSIKPIPLTEEWLLNFGFEVYRFGFKENQYRLKDRLIVIRNGLFCDYGTSVIIKHVHQLQNLYFALTGEELTLSK